MQNTKTSTKANKTGSAGKRQCVQCAKELGKDYSFAICLDCLITAFALGTQDISKLDSRHVQ